MNVISCSDLVNLRRTNHDCLQPYGYPKNQKEELENKVHEHNLEINRLQLEIKRLQPAIQKLDKALAVLVNANSKRQL